MGDQLLLHRVRDPASVEAERLLASKAPDHGETCNYDHFLPADTALLTARHHNVLHPGQVWNHGWPCHHRTQGHLQHAGFHFAAQSNHRAFFLHYLGQEAEDPVLALLFAVCKRGREARRSDLSSERYLAD